MGSVFDHRSRPADPVTDRRNLRRTYWMPKAIFGRD
jgi:hypothetical protein